MRLMLEYSFYGQVTHLVRSPLLNVAVFPLRAVHFYHHYSISYFTLDEFCPISAPPRFQALVAIYSFQEALRRWFEGLRLEL